MARRALKMRKRLRPGGPSSTPTDLRNLARLLLARRDLEKAERPYREAAEMCERTQGKELWPGGNARSGPGCGHATRAATWETTLLQAVVFVLVATEIIVTEARNARQRRKPAA